MNITEVNITNELEIKRMYLKSYRLQQMKISRFVQMMDECPERELEYRQKIRQAQNIRDHIEVQIEKVDGGVLSEILLQKYVCGRSLEEISYGLNYSKRQTERLHIRALEKLRI